MQCMTMCESYQSNDNPNKTCQNKQRCVLFSEDCTCYNYKEKASTEVSNQHNKGGNK